MVTGNTSSIPLLPRVWYQRAEQLTNDIGQSLDALIFDHSAATPSHHPGIHRTACRIYDAVDHELTDVKNIIESINQFAYDQTKAVDKAVAQEWMQQGSLQYNATVHAYDAEPIPRWISKRPTSTRRVVRRMSAGQLYTTVLLFGQFADTGMLTPLLQRMYATQEQVNASFLEYAQITLSWGTPHYEDTRSLMYLFFMSAFHEAVHHYDPNVLHEWQFPLIAQQTIDLWTDDVRHYIHDAVLTFYAASFREQQNNRKLYTSSYSVA